MLGFGQRTGQIIQMAYVVENIHSAINWWIKDTGTGPWFLLDHFLAPDHQYRGGASTADVTIAMSFAGHMQIELIQPLDANPSVYRETIRMRGHGFHHVGIASSDVERDVAAYCARGYGLAFKAAVPTGGSVAYLDGGPDKPGFVELIPVTEQLESLFSAFWRASVDWDGSAPVRPFAMP